MPFLITSLYLIARSQHHDRQRPSNHNRCSYARRIPASIVSENPLSSFFSSFKDNRDRSSKPINYLNEFSRQIGQTISISFNLTKDTIISLERGRKQCRNFVFSNVRKVPLTRQLSDDYIYGCIDSIFTIALLSMTLLAVRSASRRFDTVDDIPKSLIRRQVTLRGKVISVRDGDNLRIEHKPLLNLKWIYQRMSFIINRKIKNTKNSAGRSKEVIPLSKRTINIRLAGVDAPECAHGIHPGQPYGPEARAWLKAFTLDKPIKFKLHSTDQYNRLIATVYIKRSNLSLRWRNVGLELVKAGYATLYKGTNASYGSEKILQQYIKAEGVARTNGRGMWAEGSDGVVLPSEFKKMIREVRSGKRDSFDIIERGSSAKSKGGGQAAQNEDQVQNILNLLAQGYQWLKKFR